MKASNLVLSRKPGTSLEIDFQGTKVNLLFDKKGKITIQAPREVIVRRGELITKDQNPKS